MAKQQILLVDADPSSTRVLEVSLRSAGFNVTVADSAESALAKLEHSVPDLVLSDTHLPGADGFELVKKMRAMPDMSDVPVVFVTEQGALDDKLRGLELGVDDYLAKPIFVREVVTRVHMLLARRNKQRIAAESLARTRFSGALEDVAVVDLLQTIEVSRKSGVATVVQGKREAKLFFRLGQLVDAEVGELRGEEAVYRTLTWTKGTFDLEFRDVDRAAAIDVPTHALLMEGLRRVDELGRLSEQLPPQDSILDIDHTALLERLTEIPDELNAILRQIDGTSTLLDLVDGSPFDDLSTLTVLSKFFFEGLIVVVEPSAPTSVSPSAPPSVPSPMTRPSGIPLPPISSTRQLGRRQDAPAIVGIAQRVKGGQGPATRTAGSPSEPVLGARATVAPDPPAPAAFIDESQRPPPAKVGKATQLGGLLAARLPERTPTPTGGIVSQPVVPVEAPKVTATKATQLGLGKAAREQIAKANAAATAQAKKPTPAPVENQFFDDGDEGTYRGGPRSSKPPKPSFEEQQEPSYLPGRPSTPAQLARARQGKGVLALLLSAAVVLLAVAWWVTQDEIPTVEDPFVPVAEVVVTDTPSEPPPAQFVEPIAEIPEPVAEIPEPVVEEPAAAIEAPVVKKKAKRRRRARRRSRSRRSRKKASVAKPSNVAPVVPQPRSDEPPTASFPMR